MMLMSVMFERQQLPVRVSTRISGLISFPSGNGRLSGTATSGAEKYDIYKSRTGSIQVQEADTGGCRRDGAAGQRG